MEKLNICENEDFFEITRSFFPNQIPYNVKGKIVVTAFKDMIKPLFEAGASHVFFGDNALEDAEKFQRERDREKFFNFYKTSDINFTRELKRSMRVFSSQVPLLLLGESGVGKTYLAKKMHDFLLKKKPFVAKNLSELSPQIIESELFGHIKGAFTGATCVKEGLLEKANEGTLFLDEIGTLPLDIQIKLLKVLDEGTFSPVGSHQKKQISFNLITATCDNLEELKEKKLFREDFYFRIAGDILTIPPLRERPQDILSLIDTFQQDYSRQLYFTEECLEEFSTRPWRGNVRELHYFYKKLQRQESSFVSSLPLLEKITNIEQKFPLKKEEGLPGLLSKIELSHFKKSLLRNNNRPNHVCKELKISKSVFYRLLEKHKLTIN